ncbi:MAG: hypothetical protein H7Z16_10635 [Pyrinomonadaceae bacterium]|nr:hypothetical protein [Pyrinomonadaceae bacterium]
MKKIISVLASYAGAAVLAASFASVGELNAQTATPSPAPAAAAAPAAPPGCSTEAKLAWYTEFRAIFKTEQDKAYVLAQKYLACPTAAGEESIASYLRDKFVAPMDKARRGDKVKALVYEQKDYPKAFELGKQVLADEPENLRVLIDLAYAGYPASTKADTFNADALTYAKKAIQLLESGRAPEIWDPYTGKDEALAYLNNTIGVLTLPKAPAEALRYFLKAGQLEGKLKKDAITYGNIGDAYTDGPFKRLSDEYNRLYKDKDETPESKLALENLNQVIDRIIDAYARAVALSGTDAASLARKKVWMDTLTGLYKFRNKDSDAGLPALIAAVMSKPLPPEPTPITTLPTTAPATTTTPVSGAATGSGNGAAATVKPATSTPTTPAVTTAPKPTTTTPTTAVKPKPPKNNHPKPRTRRN